MNLLYNILLLILMFANLIGNKNNVDVISTQICVKPKLFSNV